MDLNWLDKNILIELIENLPSIMDLTLHIMEFLDLDILYEISKGWNLTHLRLVTPLGYTKQWDLKLTEKHVNFEYVKKLEIYGCKDINKFLTNIEFPKIRNFSGVSNNWESIDPKLNPILTKIKKIHSKKFPEINFELSNLKQFYFEMNDVFEKN